jgi:hypothetical protein
LVTWAVPAGVVSILGRRDVFGLTWLLGLDRPADALTVVLRRGLAIDRESVEAPR